METRLRFKSYFNYIIHNKMSQKISITPMMEQYLRLKEEHKDKLLLYRLGDFYELFFEDAKIAALEMDIVLTTRGKHLDKDIPMCGVPHLKLDHYLAKLIKSGHIVAICEQVESAEEAKKRGSKSIVKREVTRIITPGTLIEEGYLESSRNNFLFTFVEKNSDGTAAWLDFSTGSIFIKDTISQRLIELIYEVKPSEIVLDNKSFYDLLNKRSDMPIVTISENGEPLYKKKLDDLIPLEGAVPQGRSVNKCLEKFRVAQNLIYDLFNNGLCNRKAHFRQFFGWAPYVRNGISDHEFNRYNLDLEPIFTKIIIDAYKEQKNLGTI